MKNIIFTDSVINDTINKITYKKLTKWQEQDYIKKAKLSFYYEVDEKMQELYLNYYFEVFPIFKNKYIQADDREKEILLKNAIEKSKIYRDRFIENNQLLVLYSIKSFKSNIEKSELFQVGNLTLINALKKYDIEKGLRFSTYATTSIRREVEKHLINKEAMIRMPKYSFTKKRELQKAKIILEDKLHRKPTIEELSEYTGISKKNILEFEEFDLYKANPISTNSIISYESDTTIEESIPDEIEPFTDKIINKMIINDLMKDSSLTSLENKIIKLRYGLEDGNNYTLNSIGEMFDLSTERIRQLEVSALKKMRKKLNDYDKSASNKKLTKKRGK